MKDDTTDNDPPLCWWLAGCADGDIDRNNGGWLAPLRDRGGVSATYGQKVAEGTNTQIATIVCAATG